jgi:hypothetical protein
MYAPGLPVKSQTNFRNIQSNAFKSQWVTGEVYNKQNGLSSPSKRHISLMTKSSTTWDLVGHLDNQLSSDKNR